MTTYFISDLHLSDQHPHLLKLFEHFIKEVLHENDQLYILGDLFEYWIGDDQISHTNNVVKRLLKNLQMRKISWYFLAGNRDFLVGKKFLEETNGILLPEKKVITLNGKSVLLLHGDTLCTNDVVYQAFRRKVNQKWLQKLFLMLPFVWRQKLANRLRDRSMAQGQALTEEMMDVAEVSVQEAFHGYQVDVMIHGHVHRPGVHVYTTTIRYVLADWDTMGNYLRHDDQNGFSLNYFMSSS